MRGANRFGTSFIDKMVVIWQQVRRDGVEPPRLVAKRLLDNSSSRLTDNGGNSLFVKGWQ